MNNDSLWAGRHDSPLDRAIDRAVRDMVQVDPPPGWRRRVLARLHDDSRPAARIDRRFAWAAAAFVMAVAAVMLMRAPATEPVAIEQASRTAPTPPAAPAPRVEGPHDDLPVPPPAAPRAATSRVTREAIPMPRVANVFGSQPRGVAAADSAAETIWRTPADANGEQPSAIPPLAIAPVAPAPIETPAIAIPPLATASPKGGQ